MDLIYFVLIAYGLTQILCYGKIFDKIRPSHYFFKCPMCIGFWVGIILWSISPFTELFTYVMSPTTGFLLGCLSSGTSYMLNVIFNDKGVQINVNN